MKSFPTPILDVDSRLDPTNRSAISKIRGEITDTLRDKVKKHIIGEAPIYCELTAGLDSRAVLSLLISTANLSRLTATSVGDPNSIDVATAKRIAWMYGVTFVNENEPLTKIIPDDFIALIDLLAFSLNGDVQGNVASIQSMPALLSEVNQLFCGDGGEIYRGFYYPKGSEIGSELSTLDALSQLRRSPLRRIQRLPWATPDFADVVLTRLEEVFE